MARVYEARSPVKNAPDAPMLSIGIPTRKACPLEFTIHLMQVLNPLNTRVSYIIEKAADRKGGFLPAAARNNIIETAIAAGTQYLLFLDDDVLFPDITFYRLWVLAQKHPEAACITGVGMTKLEPSEPLMYADSGSGAYWDWPLGVLLPIHSAWAGCMIVNMAYVKRLEAPWFNDVVTDTVTETGEMKRNTWGHDRYFHRRLAEEAGGKVYADTGLLLAHWDTEIDKPYIVPPDAPCFQRPPQGEAYVPYISQKGLLSWRRLVYRAEPLSFAGWLDWCAAKQGDGPGDTDIMSILGQKKVDNVDVGDPVERWLASSGVPRVPDPGPVVADDGAAALGEQPVETRSDPIEVPA